MRSRHLALLLLTAGCTAGTGPETNAQFDVMAGFDQPFDLKIGEQAFIRESGILVRFAGLVGDSRCPSHALILCVWEGEGVVLIETSSATANTRVDTLHTRLEPRAVDLGEVRLELVRLDPYPETTDPIPIGDYSARFVARRGN